MTEFPQNLQAWKTRTVWRNLTAKKNMAGGGGSEGRSRWGSKDSYEKMNEMQSKSEV